MKEIIQGIYIILTAFSCILLFLISCCCVFDTSVIWSDLINGKNVEYQRFILDILGCIFMCYNAHSIANSEWME